MLSDVRDLSTTPCTKPAMSASLAFSWGIALASDASVDAKCRGGMRKDDWRWGV